jgi:hypothetical protein
MYKFFNPVKKVIEAGGKAVAACAAAGVTGYGVGYIMGSSVSDSITTADNFRRYCFRMPPVLSPANPSSSTDNPYPQFGRPGR